MIRIGIAGIPYGAKGKGTEAGIRYLRSQGLDAMEIQFGRNVYMTPETAKSVAPVAREERVDLSVHAPYYVNLSSKTEKTIEKSKDWILKSARVGAALNASVVTIHAAREENLDLVISGFKEIVEDLKKEKISVPLGLETMGDLGEFGSVDDVLEVVRKVPGTGIVIDFAHIYARTDGGLNTVEDFTAVLDQVAGAGIDHYHIHFSGIEHKNSREVRHLPLDGKPDFSLLARALLKCKADATVICESPLLEEDALKMKQIIAGLEP
ncbi:TIM barrel protein [Methanocella sp. MCL-LM]|uniref:TIM barrel protein n=1 Tax=Methanocella sp. MCL-LM TaxID=3412035 RepID=UPI003C722771